MEYFRPDNARIDFFSTTFGRPADFDGVTETAESACVLEPSVHFDREKAGPPRVDPWFGTFYWVQDIDSTCLEQWSKCSQPQLPPDDSMLSLPLQNPFIPAAFDLKSLPPDDCHHPLLNCSLKLCISVGKKKVRIPAHVRLRNPPISLTNICRDSNGFLEP